jgi:hypothetical protein
MSTPAEHDHTVIPFPGSRKVRRSADDLGAYSEPPESASDYRQRMLVNAAVFVLVLGLIGAALWIADTMAEMRRNQDCVLSGRAGCTRVDAQPIRRW